ncbi:MULTISPECIES: hypothetical protein [Vibrio]|uniref:Uncharacterized protein n=2 Tax=Vibrio genomosp. F10 TaxID=723171 RepID=A0A1B9QY28_9VIBR|nr:MULTISPECIES: hypothetical protein [Vibrio]OCH75262.1 hypothetical protein A6E14_11205 [Vibrio genomosp. F10]OEE33938.1 hypothetical protein A1QO_08825 [Vibrio genomosp. F10 str. ZF-129]OEE97688.1 hypothetical protein A1QM_14175 [Vibrio genomosp. F10 str. 9ZC157]OEF03996.1 hypothetical protein A1QI_12620 [Vibrio genomosp. F10 str. 9ZB36]OEF06790.1 hypothetical protein A1QK_07645 [Vibrio genomosp. F10 str. 9ZD137]
MTPVGMEPAKLTQAQQVKPQNSQATENKGPAPLKVEQNKVTLSEEGKALLAALKELEKEGTESEKTTTSKVESFAHGALGMDHPDKIKEEDDGSYSAGQYLSAAATIGGILLAIL